jgi:uroporphyrinogen-III synthase
MIIANGTRLQEQIVKGTLLTIENLAQEQDLKPPALIVAGKTVEFYKPVPKKTFLHCGTHPQFYRQLGEIVHWPMIDIKPVPFTAAQQRDLLKSFESTQIIVLTSWYAADFFLRQLRSIGPSLSFDDKAFAVIGRRTQKALQEQGVHPAVVSQEETAQGLLKDMSRHWDLKGKRILFPRSSLPNPFLKEALEALGAQVSEITIYQNIKPAKRQFPSVPIEGVIFTSPSTVHNFLADYGIIPASWQIVAKGPVALRTLQQAGYAYAASIS